MSKNYPLFISELEKTDPKLYEQATAVFDISMAPGELDAKTKILIALALDAQAGEVEGVKEVASIARKMGATEGQIAETLRLVYSVAGNQALSIIRAAYK